MTPRAHAIFLHNNVRYNNIVCNWGSYETLGEIDPKIWIFSFCVPEYAFSPQFQSTCHYIVNHYKKILHVRLELQLMSTLLFGGGGGAQTEKLLNLYPRLPVVSRLWSKKNGWRNVSRKSINFTCKYALFRKFSDQSVL